MDPLSAKWPPQMKAVIIGGSLSGLMYGIVLSRAGHNVIVLERNVTYSAQSGQGAGIQFGHHLADFLKRFDRVEDPSPFTLPSEHIQELSADGNVKRTYGRPGHNISWGNLYQRLRDNFDAPVASSNGCSEYRTGINVTGVRQQGEKWIVTWNEGLSEQFISADFIVAADGASSRTRRALSRLSEDRLGSAMLAPQYMGYVAWRGIVPDSLISSKATELFANKTSIFRHHNGYILCYYIPGPPTQDNENGTQPGSRLLNFIWYTNQSRASLQEILTDTNGRTHQRSIAAGNLQQSVWARQRDYGMKILPKFFAEVVAAVEQPFVQAIDELVAPCPYMVGVAPRDSGSSGSSKSPRALLVGETYAVLRPNTAQGTNMIAGSALAFADVCAGGRSVNDWSQDYEYQVGLHGRFASAVGEYLVNDIAVSTLMAASRSVWFYASSITSSTFLEVCSGTAVEVTVI